MQTRSTRSSHLPIAPAVASRSPVLQRTAQARTTIEDTVRAGQVARRLGVTPLMVEQLRQTHRLLAVPCDHGFAYPSWQFEGRGILSGFPTVLGALRSHDPNSQLAFFLTSHAGLNGRTPLDALRAGELDAVLKLTRD
jgi:hypothetical protein